MKTKVLLTLALAFSLHPSALLRAAPLRTAFTYQGRLNDGANPAQGIYDLRFAIYDDAEKGAAVGIFSLRTFSVSFQGSYLQRLMAYATDARAFQRLDHERICPRISRR